LTKLQALAEKLPGWAPGLKFDLNRMLNLDFRKDVLGTLDSTVVLYGAQSEGLFFMGQSLAVKVKDAKRLLASTDIMNKVLTDAEPGVRFRKRVYRGVDMHVLAFASDEAPTSFPLLLSPTYAVHKDWLVMGLFPQSVKGSILRSGGDRKVWRAPPYYQELLAQCLKEGNPGRPAGRDQRCRPGAEHRARPGLAADGGPVSHFHAL